MTRAGIGDLPKAGRPDRADHVESSEVGRPSILPLVVALGAFVSLLLLSVALATKMVFPFDQPMLDYARRWDGWKLAWQAMTQTANIPLIFIGFGTIAWLFWKKHHREALLVFLLLAAITGGSEVLKQLVGRTRPSGTGDGIPGVPGSYPSGHVLEAMTILGILVVKFWRTSRPRWQRLGLATLVAIEVVLVGISRLVLNEHYPTDLLGGFLGSVTALGLYVWWTRPGAWATKLADTADRGPAGTGPHRGS